MRYEVLLVPSEVSLTESDWTWRRFEVDGSVSACGSRHETMDACFVEVRGHKRVFGEATIVVNLRGEAAPMVLPPPIRADLILPVVGQRRSRRQAALRG